MRFMMPIWSILKSVSRSSYVIAGSALVLFSTLASSEPSAQLDFYDWNNQSPAQKQALDYFYNALEQPNYPSLDSPREAVRELAKKPQFSPDLHWDIQTLSPESQRDTFVDFVQQLQAPAAARQ